MTEEDEVRKVIYLESTLLLMHEKGIDVSQLIEEGLPMEHNEVKYLITFQ